MTIREALEAELAAALRRRDTAVVRAVRLALSALDNAGAVAVDETPSSAPTSAHVAGAVAGLGAAQATPRQVSEQEQRHMVLREVSELAGHNERLVRLCRLDEADGVRRGMTALARALDSA